MEIEKRGKEGKGKKGDKKDQGIGKQSREDEGELGEGGSKEKKGVRKESTHKLTRKCIET